MSILSVILVIILGIWLVVPYLLCLILKFALWKYQFTSKPTNPFGLFSYSDLKLRIPMGLNQNYMISIQQISFNVWPIVKISIKGLSISILVKNEFDQWEKHQIEQFKMLEEIRTMLKRRGMLSASINNMIVNSQQAFFTQTNIRGDNSHLSSEAEFIHGVSNGPNLHAASAVTGLNNETMFTSNQPSAIDQRGLSQTAKNSGERSFIQRSIRNLLSSTTVELENSDINFYLYKDNGDGSDKGEKPREEPSGQKKVQDEELILDFQNIRKFDQVLNSKIFKLKNLCFRLHFPNASMKVLAISDDEFDLQIRGDRCIVVNPCFPQKQGLIEGFEVLMKLPIYIKMLQFVGNYDLQIKIQKACFDLNKKFIKKFCKWFVSLYTLKVIIQVAKNIVLKTHYQDEFLKSQAVNSLSGTEVIYENYRDTMIPKRLKVAIQDGIDLTITDECKKLSSFLDKTFLQSQHAQRRSSNFSRKNESAAQPERQRELQVVIVKLEKTTFELLRKMQNTYYFITKTDKGDLSINDSYKAIKFEGFVGESDFTFRKEVTDLPVKKSKLLWDNKIQLEKIDMGLNAPLFNSMMEVVNMYQAMVWYSSIRHKIKSLLLNDDFLKNNVLLQNQQKLGTEYERQILQFYKPTPYQDEVSWTIKLQELKLKMDRDLDREEIKESDDDFFSQNFKRNQSFGQESNASIANDLLKSIKLKSSSIEFFWVMSHGKIKKSLQCQQLVIQPIQNKYSVVKDNKNFTQMPPLSIFASKNLKYRSVVHLSDVRRQKEIYFDAQRLQLDVNYEILLDMSPELIDLQIIYQHFQAKWQSKYKVRDPIPHDVIERQFNVDHFTLIWNLSTSRIILFNFNNMRTENEYFYEGDKRFVKTNDQIKFVLKMKEGEVRHYKYLNENQDEFLRCNFVPIQTHVINGNGSGQSNSNKEVEQIQDQIMVAEDLEWRYELTSTTRSFKLIAQKASVDLPDKFHFCSVIYEIQKQYYHGKQWLDEKIQQQKRLFSFIRMKPKQDTSHFYNSRNLTMQIIVKDILFSIQENKLKKVFVDKNEIQDIFKQKDYFRVRYKSFQNYWSRLQESKLNDYYLSIKGKNFLMSWEIPHRFRDNFYVLDMIKSLDEGRNYINSDTFKSFKPGIQNFKFDYAYMVGRNMQKPVLELWKINWTQKVIVGEVNPVLNFGLFTTEIIQKIFMRFDLKRIFNKIPTKHYLDMNIDIHKLRINIQGQQTLLFLNDLYHQLIARFVWEDISRGVDPDRKYLKFFQSLDRHRNRIHGQLKFSVLNTQIAMYSRRNFNRFDQYFLILFNDFIYHQVFQKQQICMRDLIVKKEPLLQFETLFMKLPVIELRYWVEYNDGRSINHFINQQNIKSMDDWIKQVKSYMAKSQKCDLKLNVPTLGCYNETQRKCLYLPLLMQSYAQNSPIPIFHFQRSHMQFFDEFIREFQSNRIDISGKVIKKTLTNKINRNHRYVQNFAPEPFEKSETKFGAFFNDIILISSHFNEDRDLGMQHVNIGEQETDIFGGLALDEQFITPDEIDDDTKRDAYLDIYDGIIFSTENICVKSEFTYTPNQVNYFKINDSLASFDLLRFCKMTSKNLFKIRNPCFQIQRSSTQRKSLNNYQLFCAFFDLDENKSVENVMKVAQEKFSEFKFPPVELIEYEMDINEHCHYNLAYGVQNQNQRKFKHDPNLKYKQLLGNFKTLFPKYILNNDQIQKEIQRINYAKFESDGGDLNSSPDQSFTEKKINFQQSSDLKNDLEDDFNFTENDTFATVIHSEYRQDKQIHYTSINKQAQQNSQSRPSSETQGLGPLGTGGAKINFLNKNQSQAQNTKERREAQKEDIIHVKHLIDIKGVRFLYTKKILELLQQHLVKGFDYKQFRRTDYIDQRSFQDKRNLQSKSNKKSSDTKERTENKILNLNVLHKEATIAIRLEQAQVNFQNHLTESQMLICSPLPVIAVVFTYDKKQAPSLLQNEEQEFIKKKGGELSDKKNEELKQEFENELNALIHEMDGQKHHAPATLERMKSLKSSIQKRDGGYIKDPLNRDALSLMATTANFTGYQFSTNRDIIKTELEIMVREMDCYVAPTFINIENPTFWMNQGNIGVRGFRLGASHGRDSFGKHNMFGDFSPQKNKSSTPTGAVNESFRKSGGFNFQELQGVDSPQLSQHRAYDDMFNFDKYDIPNQDNDTENLLRKIIFVNDISFNFGFLKTNFVDNFNPKLTLDILVEKLEGSMNGSEWNSFYDIVNRLLMSRGEKAAEAIQIENKRIKQMKRMKTEYIRDIINVQLKNQYKEQQNEIAPDIAKSISYSISKGKITLFNENKEFSAMDIEGIRGKSLIYSNRRSKQDFDIEQITIENLLDGDNYRWVLYPGDNVIHNSYSGNTKGPARTMIQSRLKDNFIDVYETSWRVYDQIELDIFPSRIQLTHNLYVQFKKFIFDQHYQNKLRENQANSGKKKGESKDQTNKQQQDKKYQLLVPSKKMPKAKNNSQKVPANDDFHKASEESNSLSRAGSSEKISKKSGDGIEPKQVSRKLILAAENRMNPPAKLDGRFNTILDEVTKKSINDPGSINPQPQNIFQALASQRQIRGGPQGNQSYNQDPKLHSLHSSGKKKTITTQEFPVFLKIFKMNEINVTITYFHEKNSFLNSRDLRFKLAPFMSRCKFLPLKQVFDHYEKHCKKSFVSQIPNILKQKFLKVKSKVDNVSNQGVTNSLLQGVNKVRVMAVSVGVDAQKKIKKERRKKRREERKAALEGAGGPQTGPNISFQGPNVGEQNSDSEFDSNESSDFEDEEDDEYKKAKELQQLEFKEAKLREHRKILFGDFAVI